MTSSVKRMPHQILLSSGDAVANRKMDSYIQRTRSNRPRRLDNSLLLIIIYIFLLIIQTKCQTLSQASSTKTLENLDSNLDNTQCHSCRSSKKIELSDTSNHLNSNQNVKADKEKGKEEIPNQTSFVEKVMKTATTFTRNYLLINKTELEIENEIERLLDNILNKEKYILFDGIEIKTVKNDNAVVKNITDVQKGRSYFPKYSYEYRLYEKVKNFVDTHILSINLPKAARLFGFRSFGLKKFFLPLLIGAQIFKSVLLAMFLPSILGSFGKILGKGISQVSAASSQASYPPAPVDEQGFSNDNKDYMAYETNANGMYTIPQEYEANDVDDLANVDMSRYGPGGQKVSFLPTKNGYYANQMAASNNYKVFHKIPASSMILNNYDPFYSPLLSRLDGIFARLGLSPDTNAVDTGQQVGGQTISEMKLESCREQLICVMYASPAKYAPYSNLISAQLSRELNELRRPVSDNPEILRFFRYMRAARRGQEGADCMRIFPTCARVAAPAHTMIAAYHDINKLVTARKLHVE